ncbi:hypothetical protein PLCT2_01952 [Planctomycetaceae bacterium]|nr:hypothetical protein PLCT2_01952 [Planctomycetaceae bacterium]
MSTLEKIAREARPIELHDELAEFLGFSPVLRYTLEDAGKFAGHLCPTVATAFEMTRLALRELYDSAIPQRGHVAVTVASQPDAFANGPLAQVIGFITGAAGVTGFKGVAGRFNRQNLLHFDAAQQPFGSVTFKRLDTGAAVRVLAFGERIAPEPEMPAAMRGALAGDATASEVFKEAWARRVRDVVEHADRIIQVENLGTVGSRA